MTVKSTLSSNDVMPEEVRAELEALLSFALQLRDGRRKEEENQSHFVCTLRHSEKQSHWEKATQES